MIEQIKIEAELSHEENSLASCLLHLYEIPLDQTTAWCATALLTEDNMKNIVEHKKLFVKLKNGDTGCFEVIGVHFREDLCMVDFIGFKN